MATTAPRPFHANNLRSQVIATSERVARESGAHNHVRRGPGYAADFLGCDRSVLAVCIAGALVESELPVLAAKRGLMNGRVVRRFNCF